MRSRLSTTDDWTMRLAVIPAGLAVVCVCVRAGDVWQVFVLAAKCSA